MVCRKPALCDVCFSMWDAPGDVVDAFYEAGIDFVEVIEEPLEAAFTERWRSKVARGMRHGQ